MDAIGALPPSYDSNIEEFTRCESQFAGRKTSESEATRQTESNRSFDETPSLKDRLIYPLYAAKNRILKIAGFGAKAGIFTPMIAAAAICGLAGNIIGTTVGSLVQSIFFMNSDISASKTGTLVGLIIGGVLALPAALVLGAVAAAAFAVIGLAGSVFTLPVDVYHAITLDNKADLHPEPVRVKDILHEIKRTDPGEFFGFSSF
ncbi:hypothetical protein [Endozoicomonas sp. ONNA2]|uniref:hypothetical protein n=1 Tax=Endozoicomonas sp. ONNA2 TaxID=2828741 RepID=UPI002148F4B9|nr:hypothetical protein [Endozoicomonas sp. ONNA2]